MIYNKKQGALIKNGTVALQEHLRKLFENQLLPFSYVPSEAEKELEQAFQCAYLEGSRGKYVAEMYALSTYEPDQAEYLVRMLAEDIKKDWDKDSDIVPVFRKRLSVDIQNNKMNASTRIAFVPRDELIACIGWLKLP